jgi:hypothetical protein
MSYATIEQSDQKILYRARTDGRCHFCGRYTEHDVEERLCSDPAQAHVTQRYRRCVECKSEWIC